MDDLKKSFKELEKEIGDKAIKKVLLKNGAPVLSTMRQLVPKDTGRLARSIKFLRPDKVKGTILIGPDFTKDNKGTATIAGLASIAEYGATVRVPRRKTSKAQGFWRYFAYGKWHTGTMLAAIPARPFIRPAWEKNASKVEEGIKNDLVEIIEKKGKKLNLK